MSANIARLLSSKALNFSYFGYTQVHRQIFDGVYKFAGKIRDYEISKREWVLRGDTVSYGYAFELKEAIEYDLEQERQFNYGGLSRDEIATHIAHFVAYLWQIHAFPEGNNAPQQYSPFNIFVRLVSRLTTRCSRIIHGISAMPLCDMCIRIMRV